MSSQNPTLDQTQATTYLTLLKDATGAGALFTTMIQRSLELLKEAPVLDQNFIGALTMISAEHAAMISGAETMIKEIEGAPIPSGRATINGRVLDASGSAVAGLTVVARPDAPGIGVVYLVTATTSATGEFTLSISPEQIRFAPQVVVELKDANGATIGKPSPSLNVAATPSHTVNLEFPASSGTTVPIAVPPSTATRSPFAPIGEAATIDDVKAEAQSTMAGDSPPTDANERVEAQPPEEEAAKKAGSRKAAPKGGPK